MVEVFKTNVHCAEAAAKILDLLRFKCADCEVSFDLEDCDRVLRVAGDKVVAAEVMLLLKRHGFECLIMDY